jgi:ElaA protein
MSSPAPGAPPLKVLGLPFGHLDPEAVYAICKIRQDVFVVEQQCPYPDLDGRDVDPETRHVLLVADDALLGYARVVDDGDVWRIGRVLLAPDARGRGWADAIMDTALNLSKGRDVVLDAQTPLAGWYATFGFDVAGPDFVEDGIPHTPMRLRR